MGCGARGSLPGWEKRRRGNRVCWLGGGGFACKASRSWFRGQGELANAELEDDDRGCSVSSAARHSPKVQMDLGFDLQSGPGHPGGLLFVGPRV